MVLEIAPEEVKVLLIYESASYHDDNGGLCDRSYVEFICLAFKCEDIEIQMWDSA